MTTLVTLMQSSATKLRDMTYRAQGWLYAIAISFSFWSLVAIVSHEAIMLWDQPADSAAADEAA